MPVNDAFDPVRFRELGFHDAALGFSLDLSGMRLPAGWPASGAPDPTPALQALHALESGSIANPDEGRQVGHYWLRTPDLAPEASQTRAVRDALTAVKEFAAGVAKAQIRPAKFPRFSHALAIGIGGSALGPQFLAKALATPGAGLETRFLDNTDPEGLDLVLDEIAADLPGTLVIVTSKSGGTPETRNGMLEARRAFETRGLDFASQAVAITGEGSRLDQLAATENWLARFPMWDWVGGRTSITSAVGLLPAALMGIDVDAFLEGAAAMDALTRQDDTAKNPALRLALAWHHATEGRGARDMVILPYKDRLDLFARYLQQLVMESLGKEKDLDGALVHQGIAVYGNKGSTDQHAYVQQLRDGVENFFVTFIEVLKDRDGDSIEVDPGITTGDYLNGFFQGTRRALAESGRRSMTLTLDAVTPRSVGALIALFERAVGLYASLVNINAYHQPGVEAGKKAAGEVLAQKPRILEVLAAAEAGLDAAEVAEAIGTDAITALLTLRHLAANRDDVSCEAHGEDLLAARFRRA